MMTPENEMEQVISDQDTFDQTGENDQEQHETIEPDADRARDGAVDAAGSPQ
jgi:hypothetical protein